jgi:hypothetical protein
MLIEMTRQSTKREPLILFFNIMLTKTIVENTH